MQEQNKVVEYREAVVRLAEEKGWFVFPCKPNKKPFTKNGFKDASSDPEQVRKWWTQHPNALVGMPTGGNGLFVLDVDVHKDDGFASLAALEKTHGALPAGPYVDTPSSGRHYYFRAPLERIPGCSASKIGPGLDIRGEGGYVIVPPSPGYVWHNSGLLVPEVF